MQQVANPIYGANRFKLGLFNANCDGGFAVSTAPERWAAEWDEVVAVSKLADEAGARFHPAGCEMARPRRHGR
jgi:hypothetical protein